ncbi:MAG: methionine adenosyltransferase [Clostridia bacterium]|nr:methionine adenosyltransferase [Clostridia bacterium]
MKKFFTSESVTEGHPDKVCDAISDAIVDAVLSEDGDARCAVECCAAHDRVLIMGEISTSAKVDYERIARDKIREIGYTFGEFSADTCQVILSVHSQSPDIAMGVDESAEYREGGDVGDDDMLGAGDQGMMFGYACSETKGYMPLTLSLAHQLARRLSEVRKDGTIPYLRPDGKTQVTVEYDGKTPKRVDCVVVSAQHEEGAENLIKGDIMEKVIKAVIPGNLLDSETKYFINPTGKFVIGGPEGDSGLTGRKIIVDTYGGRCPHGGGCFSGKDPTKVDRSAAYMARYICKNLVAAGLCEEVELQVAYAIGVCKPVSVYVNSYGTGKLDDSVLSDIIVKEFDLRPAAIIKTLNLRTTKYAPTAVYGHFGKSSLPWELTDRTEDLRKYLTK